MKTLSAICEEIYQRMLTDEERKVNSVNMLEMRMSALLVQKQDLTECVFGEVETKQGREHGICGEMSFPMDGAMYWLPKYSDRGYDYIMGLFADNRSILINQPSVADQFRYSRRLRLHLKAQHEDVYQVYLMEGPAQYWVFDEDALLLSEIFCVPVNETPRGHNLTYKKEFHEGFIKRLRSLQVSYCVVHPSSEEIFVAKDLPLIEYGVKFRAKDQYGESERYIILSEDDTSAIIPIEREDGTIEWILRPVPEIGGFIRLSPEAPLAQALDGATVGETRVCGEYSYTIEEIFTSGVKR